MILKFTLLPNEKKYGRIDFMQGINSLLEIVLQSSIVLLRYGFAFFAKAKTMDY